MHVTAADPKFVTSDEIDEDFKNKEEKDVRVSTIDIHLLRKK